MTQFSGFQRAAIQMLRPGNTLKAYHKAVGTAMEEELIQLGLLDAADVKNQDENAPLYRTYFMHGTSTISAWTFMITVTPHGPSRRHGLYLRAGHLYREEGIGVRIENDVLVTDEGPVDLMQNIPIEVEAIESLMAE